MGRIKSEKQKKKANEYSLSKFEINLFKAIIINRNAAFNQHQALAQAFLTYLAGTKWGYENPELYDFEVDSDREVVKVTKKAPTEE